MAPVTRRVPRKITPVPDATAPDAPVPDVPAPEVPAPLDEPVAAGEVAVPALLGGVLPIIALVALDRIFNRRYW